MPLVPVALTNKSNPARYKQGGSAQLINCYVESIGEEGKTPWAIYASDGLQGFAQLSTADGGVRAFLNVDGTLWVVAGTSARLYRVTVGGGVTDIGALSGFDETGPVFMERNRRATPDIAIVNNGLMFYYRTTLAQVTDVDLLAPTSLAFVAGYFVIGTANNTWQVGALDDASAWDALDFERADSSPDAVVRVAQRQTEIVIFGEVSTEFWAETGGTDGVPFSKSSSMDIGLAASDSVATVDQTLVFVASDRTVRMLSGYQGTIISTSAVERDITSLSATDRANITATSWTANGHTFYSITSDAWTWVYDTRTGLWHNRASYGQPNWKIAKVCEFGGKIIAADRDVANLYEMSPTFFDEAGDPLVMEATLAPVHAWPKEITCHSVHMDAEKGVGTGQGDSQDIDPHILLSWSLDGGYTFNYQRRLPLGVQGKRTVELRTNRLGQSEVDGFVFKIQCSAKVARAVYQMSAEMEGSD
jgi:hypothetical protein